MIEQMPHNNEAEQSVLGAIILDKLIGSTQEVLLPESFYRGAPTYLQSNDEFK